MRILPSLAETVSVARLLEGGGVVMRKRRCLLQVAFARLLEGAGVAAVAVHGRRREQRHHEGRADWDAIAAVKSALRIPVLANGNVRTRRDAEACVCKNDGARCCEGPVRSLQARRGGVRAPDGG